MHSLLLICRISIIVISIHCSALFYLKNLFALESPGIVTAPYGWHIYSNLSMGRSLILYYLLVLSSPCCCISWLVIYTVIIEISLVTWHSSSLVFSLSVFGVFAQDTWIQVDLKKKTVTIFDNQWPWVEAQSMNFLNIRRLFSIFIYLFACFVPFIANCGLSI